jgi:superfamily II DNA or RNA helicase
MIEQRPYQQEAIEWLSTRRRGVVVAPAGSGKTVIAAGALCRVVCSKPRTQKVRVGWLCNTIEQAQQAEAAINSFPRMLPLIEIKIACSAAATDWSDRDVLICDECHHAGSADGWYIQTVSCEGARWGFTATPPDDPNALFVWQNLFGEVFTVNRQDIAANLSPARVVLLNDTDPDLQNSMDEEIEKTFRRRKRYSALPEGELRAMVMWQVCIEMGIVENRARNAAAVRAARQHSNDSVLILVNRVEHGQDLAKQIPNSICCYAGMGAKKRRAALEGFKDGSVKCVVATSLADEGLDVPRANVLVLVSAGRSRIKTEQRTGRVLRNFAGKTGAIIYDFTDRQHPLMAKHSRLRQQLYQELGYSFSNIS